MRRMAWTTLLVLMAVNILMAVPGAAVAQGELNYEQYRALNWAAARLDHVAAFEPTHGEEGMYTALAERFGTVIVIKHSARGAERVWKSNQLSGIPDEVMVADLNGDSLEDAIICRTNAGKVYVWSMEDYTLIWESLPSEYRLISCFTSANMDDDQANELVLLADGKIVYIDGETFNKDWTSLNDFSATIMRCGDVDGDGRVEIVLNSGKVLDSATGGIEWEEEAFYTYLELLDIDGDGMPEVLTENGISGPVKVYDMDYGNEVRFR